MSVLSAISIENISAGDDDRLLDQKTVLTDIFNDSFTPLTWRRMWKRGEMPAPIKLGGQNFWWESSIQAALKLKAQEAVANAIQAQKISESKK